MQKSLKMLLFREALLFPEQWAGITGKVLADEFTRKNLMF